MDEEAKKTRQRHLKAKTTGWKGLGTHDCAFLEPLAFPPDLPPVILSEFGGWVVEKMGLAGVRGWC
jgi:hypothetical protein